MTPVSSDTLYERLKDLWPLPPNVTHMEILMGASKLATVKIEFLVKVDSVEDIVRCLMEYNLVPKPSP